MKLSLPTSQILYSALSINYCLLKCNGYFLAIPFGNYLFDVKFHGTTGVIKELIVTLTRDPLLHISQNNCRTGIIPVIANGLRITLTNNASQAFPLGLGRAIPDSLIKAIKSNAGARQIESFYLAVWCQTENQYGSTAGVLYTVR